MQFLAPDTSQMLVVFFFVSEQDLFQIIIDLFLAGTDTTTGSVEWLLTYLVNYPQVQTKCREEIHQVRHIHLRAFHSLPAKATFSFARRVHVVKLGPYGRATLKKLLPYCHLLQYPFMRIAVH